jgi:hypothetical protein
MLLLVGPLYSKKTNEVLFGITRTPPDRYIPNDELRWGDYYNFWNSIISNTYLAPVYLRDRLKGYIVAKDAYWDAFRGSGHRMVENFEETPLGQRKKETFDLKRMELLFALEARFSSLTTEIDQIEKGFWNRLLKR